MAHILLQVRGVVSEIGACCEGLRWDILDASGVAQYTVSIRCPQVRQFASSASLALPNVERHQQALQIEEQV
jgi:hypothetical protein